MLIPKYRSRKEAPTPKIICHVHTARVFFFYQKSDLWKHQKSNRKPESSDAPTVPPVRSGKLLFPIQNQEINKKTL